MDLPESHPWGMKKMFRNSLKPSQKQIQREEEKEKRKREKQIARKKKVFTPNEVKITEEIFKNLNDRKEQILSCKIWPERS